MNKNFGLLLLIQYKNDAYIDFGKFKYIKNGYIEQLPSNFRKQQNKLCDYDNNERNLPFLHD